jgi:2-iminoacetate synthase ThiH
MEYTVEQLKAHAYDLLVRIEQGQMELRKVNEMIAGKLNNQHHEIQRSSSNKHTKIDSV